MVKNSLNDGNGDERSSNISAAARRALKEAEDRRRVVEEEHAQKEIGGRDGPDPARFGDWEVKGIASDF